MLSFKSFVQEKYLPRRMMGQAKDIVAASNKVMNARSDLEAATADKLRTAAINRNVDKQQTKVDKELSKARPNSIDAKTNLAADKDKLSAAKKKYTDTMEKLRRARSGEDFAS